MGCCNAKGLNNESDSYFKKKLVFQTALIKISSKEDLMVSQEQLLYEKKGNFFGDYELLDEIISKGNSSIIKKGIHKLTGTIVAIKIVRKQNLDNLTPTAIKNYLHGLKTLRQMDHPNLIRLLDLYNDDVNIYIVTEYYSGGELFEKIIKKKTLSEEFSSKIIKTVLLGINYLHSNQIVHRGITPENLVFDYKDSIQLKIIDFKLLTFLNFGQKLSDKVGAIRFISPEILNGSYDYKCDLWAIGILLFITLFGKFPFDGEENSEIFQKILKGDYFSNCPQIENLSEEGKDFLSKLLVVDPLKRMSAEEALNHNWIKKYNTRKKSDLSQTLENLSSFQINFKLEKIFWLHLLNFFLKPQEKEDLSNFFQELDSSGKGFLTKQDIAEALKKVKKGEDSDLEAEKIFAKLQMINGKRLNFSDFLMATLDKKTFITEEKTRVAFSLLDKDHKGKITVSDLKREFAGDSIEDFVWRELIAEVNDNAKAEDISYEDFKRIIFKFKE